MLANYGGGDRGRKEAPRRFLADRIQEFHRAAWTGGLILRGARSSSNNMLRPRRCFASFVGVRIIVRKQLVTLTLGMAVGVVSATVASLIQNALHIVGFAIFLPLWFSLFLLVLKFGPDGWR